LDVELLYDNEKIPEAAVDLLSKMLNKNVKKRINAKNCLSHTFFKEVIENTEYENFNDVVGDSIYICSEFNKLQKTIFDYINSKLQLNKNKENIDILFDRLDTDKNGTLS